MVEVPARKKETIPHSAHKSRGAPQQVIDPTSPESRTLQVTPSNPVVQCRGIMAAWASRSSSSTSEAHVLSSTSLLNGGCAMLTRNLSAFSCTTGVHRPVGIRRGRPTSRSAIGVCLRTLTFPLNSSTNKPHRIPTGYCRCVPAAR